MHARDGEGQFISGHTGHVESVVSLLSALSAQILHTFFKASIEHLALTLSGNTKDIKIEI